MNNEFLLKVNENPLDTTVDYYASSMSEKAVMFLESNCLSADAALKVGFSDRTLGKQLPSHQCKPGRDIRKLLQDAGILKATGHETFRGFVTVPLTDTGGETTGIYGLRVDKHGGGEAEQRIGCGIFNASSLATDGRMCMDRRRRRTTPSRNCKIAPTIACIDRAQKERSVRRA